MLGYLAFVGLEKRIFRFEKFAREMERWVPLSGVALDSGVQYRSISEGNTLRRSGLKVLKETYTRRIHF